MRIKNYSTQIIVTGALVALWCTFAIASPQTFTNARIYRSFMSTIPVTLILTLGMTLLVIQGDSDLSFPSISAAGAFVFAWLYAKTGVGAPLAFAAALAAGAIMGLINGLLAVGLKLPAMIVTIGTQFFWRGLILLLADGLAIPLAEVQTEGLHKIFVGRLGSWGIPAQSLWATVTALSLGVLLNRTPFGESLLFIGDNPAAAATMGIPVKRNRILTFVLMGLLSAFAGLLATLELNNWWPTQGDGYMLLVFASVFVGGNSATGGRGTIYGSFVGAIIIGIIEAGIVSAGLVGFWTRLVHGLVIVLSMAVYSLFDFGSDSRSNIR